MHNILWMLVILYIIISSKIKIKKIDKEITFLTLKEENLQELEKQLTMKKEEYKQYLTTKKHLEYTINAQFNRNEAS